MCISYFGSNNVPFHIFHVNEANKTTFETPLKHINKVAKNKKKSLKFQNFIP